LNGRHPAADRADIVDINVDPLTERSRRRSTLLHIGLPLCGVGLIIGFLLGVVGYSDYANRIGVLGLSNTLLRSLQERITLQVSAYLEPAARAILLAQTMLGRGGATDRAEEAYRFAISVLDKTPQIANVLFADAAGNFMLVTRAESGPSGASDTKRILMTPSGRTVEWITRRHDGQRDCAPVRSEGRLRRPHSFLVHRRPSRRQCLLERRLRVLLGTGTGHHRRGSRFERRS
jgi:hypothetical protein